MRESGRIAATESQSISDVRASARYRELLVTTLVPRALARCAERIRGGVGRVGERSEPGWCRAENLLAQHPTRFSNAAKLARPDRIH